MELTETSSPEQRADWLVEKNLKGFILVHDNELLELKRICKESIVLKQQLKTALEDSDRLDCFAYIFSNYKICGILKENKMYWGYNFEGKDYGSFNIRQLIDEICIRNFKSKENE